MQSCSTNHMAACCFQIYPHVAVFIKFSSSKPYTTFMRKSISQNAYVEDGLYSKNEIANEIGAGWVEHTEGTGLNYNFISCSYCCLISGTIWIEVFTIHKNPKIQNRRQMNTGQRLISECDFLHIFLIFPCIWRNTPDRLPIMFIFDKVTQTLVLVRINIW